MKRRHFVTLLGAAFAATLIATPSWAKEEALVEVWKGAQCGCCTKWVKHLEKNGFATKVHTVPDAAPYGRKLGIPDRLRSCHTATVGGYSIEGHVPASDIRRLLAEKPKAVGLAAPGMPAGSPGMDVAGSPPYEVLLVGHDEKTTLFARHVPR